MGEEGFKKGSSDYSPRRAIFSSDIGKDKNCLTVFSGYFVYFPWEPCLLAMTK